MAFLAWMIGGPRDGERIALDVIAPSIGLVAGGRIDRYDLIDETGWLRYEFIRSTIIEDADELAGVSVDKEFP